MRGGRWSTGLVVAAGALALALVGSADAARHPRPPKPPKLVIGFVLPGGGNPVVAAISAGAQAAAKANAIDLKLVSPRRGDATSQIASIKKLVASHVTALAVVPADPELVSSTIAATVKAGIPTATVGTDATGSSRTFFYGASAAAEGRAQAARVLATLHAQHRTGLVKFIVTSCLPGAPQQRARRTAFERSMRANRYAKEFTTKQIGFFDTTTRPGAITTTVEQIYAKHLGFTVVAALCPSDTAAWGVLLRKHRDHGILVAGNDWTTSIFNLVGQGWVAWSLGQSPYDMGYASTKLLWLHISQARALPTGSVTAKSVFVTKTNLAQVRKSPDYLADLIS